MSYGIANGPFPTSTMLAGVASTTTLKTLLQIKPFNLFKISEWGWSIDGHASNTGFEVELIEVDVAATVTAHVDADIAKLLSVGDVAVASIAGLTLSTTGTGYTASAEGTITASRLLDAPQNVLGTQAQSWSKQFPLGEEPIIQIAKFGRIRVKAAGNGVNVKCWVKGRIGA